jgi:hypothetical protein
MLLAHLHAPPGIRGSAHSRSNSDHRAPGSSTGQTNTSGANFKAAKVGTSLEVLMMPGAGLEPAWPCGRGILSSLIGVMRQLKRERRELELELLNRHAEALNAEGDESAAYQSDWEAE